MSTTTTDKTSRECALIAACAADEKKATDIMVQEVRDLIGVTDYFVIATASNNRQVEAIIDEIEDAVRTKAQMKPLHREGTQDGTWSLLDYGSFVVHVFQPETREYYRLEALWNDAPVIDLAAEAGLTDIEYSDRIAKMLGNLYNKLTAVISLNIDGRIDFWQITVCELNINYSTDNLSNLTNIILCHYSLHCFIN